jgi:predicted metal-dependent hydrolase
MNLNFNKIARRWLGEGRSEASKSPNRIAIQSIMELLNTLRPSSKRDANRIEMMREQLVKIRRATKRLEESVANLEEQVNVLAERNKTLEETKSKKKGK